MKPQINNFRENARHSLLMVICFIMLAGVSSCNQEELVSESSQPKATDDATLLKEQMEKLNTRAADYNVAIVTTNTSVSFDRISCNGGYTIDWGDGTITTGLYYHKYTDLAVAHTILIYADFEKEGSILHIDNEEIISVDVSRTPSLRRLFISGNRLNSIDLSKNSSLEELRLNNNYFESIDVSNNKALYDFSIFNNPITKIDVTMLPLLEGLNVSSTKISEVDVSQNPLLNSLSCKNTAISKLDISKNPLLGLLSCSNTAIRNIDLSKAPNLWTLWVQNLQLDTLDVSQKPKLMMIFCEGLNINTLNIKSSSRIQKIHCDDSKINNIILSNNLPDLDLIKIAGTPLEQSLAKITNLAYSLPDRSSSYDGYITTSTPHLSTLTYILQNRGWQIVVR